MVFQAEGKFQQFVHSKFRENTVRVLYIPCPKEPSGHLFLAVNKFGKVGLYDPEKFTMLHTYMLDLSPPFLLESSQTLKLLLKNAPPAPRCQRTHLVADAIHAPDINSIIYATTKNLLQFYDLGDIETLSFGLEIFPRQRFLKFKQGQSPVPPQNKGHVETHRVFGKLSSAPIYCIEYFPSGRTTVLPSDNSHSNISITGKSSSKLIIGDQEGTISIIAIEDPLKLFGKKKARGVLHKIRAEDLERNGLLKRYKAHRDIVKEIRFIVPRQLIISCSRDRKFSLFIQDFTETTEPYIISLPKGVNSFAHNDSLKIIATGSDDCILRLFNQFVMKMPQMELSGHKDAIVAVEFLQVPFSDNPILVSYSKDVELRAWDPVNFLCLQSLYISFPSRSTIMSSKTPEFGKKPLLIHQPCYLPKDEEEGEEDRKKTCGKGRDGMILLLYCNSYSRLAIEKDTSHWPFDFDDFIADFEEVSTVYEKKLKDKHRAWAESKYCSKDPNMLKLNPEEIAGIEAKLDSYVHEILKIKRHADKQLRSAIYDPNKISLAGECTRKFLELQNNSKQTELFKKAGISTAFKSIPLYDLAPVEFTKAGKGKGGLPVTSLMKESGIQEVGSVSDLLTPMARKCFVVQRLKDLEFDAKITARTAEEMSELSESHKQELRRDRVGMVFPKDMNAEIEERLLTEDPSEASDHSYRGFYRKE